MSLLCLTLLFKQSFLGGKLVALANFDAFAFLQKPPTQVIDKEYKVLNHAFGYSKFAKHTASFKYLF